MKNVAKEALMVAILKWLPLGEYLINSLSKNEQLLTIRWKPISGDSVITQVNLDKGLVEDVQHALDLEDENLVKSYLEKVEDHIVMRAESYEGSDVHIWNLTPEILEG